MLILKSKRILITVSILAGIFVVSGIGYLAYRGVSTRNANDSQQETSGPVFKGIALLSITDIEKIEDPEERFATYISTASDAKFNGENNVAIEYYKAASKVVGVDESYKANTMLVAYNFAISIDDKESEEYFSGLVSDVLITENELFLERVAELDEGGNE